MSPIAIGWLVVSVFGAVGVFSLLIAHPEAKLNVWWQAIWVTRLPFLKPFMLDEGTYVVIARLLGSFFIPSASIGALVLIVLSYAR